MLVIHPYALSFTLVTILAGVLLSIVWNHREAVGARGLRYLLSGILYWSAVSAFLWVGENLLIKQFLVKFNYIGLFLAVGGMAYFVLEFTHHERVLESLPLKIAIFAPLYILVILCLTNDYHKFIIDHIEIIRVRNAFFIGYYLNIGYYIGIFLIPALYAIGSIFLLLKEYITSSKLKKKQIAIIIAAIFVPVFAIIIDYLGYYPRYFIDTTVFSFSISCILIAIAVIHFRVLDIVHVARSVLLDNITDGVIVLDTQYRLIDINPAALRDMRRTRAEALNKYAWELLPADVWSQAIVQSNSRALVKVPARRGDYFYDVLLNPIVNTGKRSLLEVKHVTDTDNSIGTIIIYRDVTSQKLLEQKISAANKELKDLNAMKDRFFSIIAHDLRTPYIALLGYCELLTDAIDSKDQNMLTNIVPKLYSATEKGFELLENLLEWARSQSGTLRLKPVQLPVSDILSEHALQYQSFAENKNITITVDSNPAHTCFADENTTKTILRNLIGNALKFTPNHGTVSLHSTIIDDYCAISVADTGIGIPENELPLLFRIDNKIKRPGTNGEPGSGLGLVLCREYAERNGGKLYAESKPGEGSTFTFTLPVSPEIFQVNTRKTTRA